MKVCILGAGSLGSLFAAYLARGGLDVSIIARPSHAEAIRTSGLEVHRVFDGDAFNVSNIHVIEDLEELHDVFAIIIAVKAFDVENALKQLLDANAFDASRQSIGLLQNGLGVEDMASSLFPRATILRFTTTNGALIGDPGVVHHTGLGNLCMGSWDEISLPDFNDNLIAMANAFTEAGMPAEICDNMREKVWQKVIVNAGINPIGAIFKVPNGRIIEVGSLMKISDCLTDEAMAVAREGNFITDAGFDGRNAVREVIEMTRPNRNSMLQDVEKGRMTEIDFINGAIARHGHELGIATPWNDAIVQILHGYDELTSIQEKEV